MVPLRTSASDAFAAAVGVGNDNARAIGTDGEAGHAAAVPRLVRNGSCVTSITGPNGGAELYER